MLRNSKDIVLYRIDPSKNMQRFYTLSIEGNLFGGGSLVRSWGRIGTQGQTRIVLFDSEITAQINHDKIVSTKLKRGYMKD